MPKYTLEFQLPEEETEYDYARQANYYARVIDEVEEFLRRKLKYEILTDAEHKVYDEVRNKLTELRQSWLNE